MLSNVVYKTYVGDKTIIQKKIVNKELDDEEIKEKKRKKPPESILYKIWERDNWTCVYCGKQLLDPKVVQMAVPDADKVFADRINKEGKKITNHIVREYLASYDHHLPVSKLPRFNFEEENLFACCLECNRKKLDSMDLNAWKPLRQNAWKKSLEIAGICFEKPTSS